MKLLSMFAVALLGTAAAAQTLPPPSRTVYRCEEHGKVRYSDAPCLGAKLVDVEPTRGLNKSTGRELQGEDVRNERFREAFAEVTKPVTGMDAKQRDQATRRLRLSPEVQRQCRVIDQQLPVAESAERTTKEPSKLIAAQKRLFELRETYRKLRCE